MLQHIAGQDIWVTQTGQGMPRLFVHCSLGRGLSLMPLAEALPDARDTFFDLPGHGKSAAWTGQDYHSESLAVARALTDAPTHVVGHSFGATVALRFALDAPEKVSRLTLIEPVMFAAARGTAAYDAHQIAFAPFVAAMVAQDRDTASAIFTAMWGTGPAWPDLPEKNRARICDQIHLIPAAAPAIEDDVHGILDRLDQLHCPVDLIEGSSTQPVIPAILDGLKRGIPQARRIVIDGADHMVPLTHPVQVARAMTVV